MNSNSNDRRAQVSAVIIGVDNLDASLDFYLGTLGLTVAENLVWSGADFEQYWQLPAGASARCAFLQHGADPVGRIQLMEFNAADRKLIRQPGVKRATGLFNLNLYTSDIHKDYEKLTAQGFNFWGEPARQNFGPGVGETFELAFDGPDGVAINLVELITTDPNTMIGHLYQYVAKYGRTPTGFTEVVTTAHTVHDMDKALAFYYGPLNMKLFVESVINAVEINRANNLPDDAQTRSVLVQGDHEYGKIALAEPMNYELPNLVADAVAPNIGYLAQSFLVDDLAATASESAALGVEVFTAPVEIELPGRGNCQSMIVRNPGSGALQELFQAL
jgi:catechol 2,3-dioxygenase-like lactoylglutathione lyase family enzyme